MRAAPLIPAPPPPPVRLRYPIVLLHGLFGFVERRIGPLRIQYFRGVRPYLESGDNRAYAIEVSPRKTIDHRARQIAAAFEAHPVFQEEEGFHLVAHSMGGLDARYAISRLGLADRVKSLTTIASPHRGSFLAKIPLQVPGLSTLARRLVPALGDLTEEASVEFNRTTPDSPSILYLSVPTRTRLLTCTPFLWPSYLVLRKRNGANDGQVALESSKWGEVLEEHRADHIQVLGMRYGLNAFNGVHHLELYRRIIQTLYDRGM